MEHADTKPVIYPSSETNPAPPPYITVQPQHSQPQFQPQYQPQPNVMTHQTFVFGQAPPTAMTVTHVVAVPDHLGLAIFSCLCCFWPLGLAAIVLAVQSKDALSRGDINTAQANSRTARVLSLISIGLGVLIIVIIIIVVTTSGYRSHSSSRFN